MPKSVAQFIIFVHMRGRLHLWKIASRNIKLAKVALLCHWALLDDGEVVAITSSYDELVLHGVLQIHVPVEPVSAVGFPVRLTIDSRDWYILVS